MADDKMKRFLDVVMMLLLLATFNVAGAVAPGKVSLEVNGKLFSFYNMEFSRNGDQVCIAGEDRDKTGAAGGRLMLVDRIHHVLLWTKRFPVPDHYADIYPVQGQIVDGRVYLLANVVTNPSPPLAQVLTDIFSFDMQGKQIAKTRLKDESANQYGYAINATANGIEVAGYTKDEDDDFEYYAVYTTLLNKALEVQGSSLIRKNGAYSPYPGGRIVGDSLYLGGVFSPGKVRKNDRSNEDFAASRMRLTNGYLWSAHSDFGTRQNAKVGVASDGTVLALKYSNSRTSLLVVPPDGKASAIKTYASRYCNTKSLAAYGERVLAVRAPCDEKIKDAGRVLVEIDPATLSERLFGGIPDEPLAVATSGSLWIAVSKSKDGKIYFYSSNS